MFHQTPMGAQCVLGSVPWRQEPWAGACNTGSSNPLLSVPECHTGRCRQVSWSTGTLVLEQRSYQGRDSSAISIHSASTEPKVIKLRLETSLVSQTLSISAVQIA